MVFVKVVIPSTSELARFGCIRKIRLMCRCSETQKIQKTIPEFLFFFHSPGDVPYTVYYMFILVAFLCALSIFSLIPFKWIHYGDEWNGDKMHKTNRRNVETEYVYVHENNEQAVKHSRPLVLGCLARLFIAFLPLNMCIFIIFTQHINACPIKAL